MHSRKTHSPPQSNKAEIAEFTLNSVTGTPNETKITFTLPYSGTDITDLTAVVSISPKASISPDPSTVKNYSNPVTFTVTSEDGTTKKVYTITVTVTPASKEAKITAFTLGRKAGTIDESQKEITFTYPHGTNVSNVVARATISPYATISPDPSEVIAYGTDQKFTVTAQDGKTEKTYTVKVTVAKNNAAEITSFTLGGKVGTIDPDTKEITFASFAAGTNITSWVATVVISVGASITPDPLIARNYSDDVIFTVKAEDGTIQRYTVKVSVLKEAKIEEFKFNERDRVDINHDKGEINISVPYHSDANSRAGLTATIFSLSSGASIKGGLNPSTTATDYTDDTNPKTVTVTAGDGRTTKTYTIRVKIQVTDANRFEVVYGEIRRLGGQDDAVFTESLNHLDMSGVATMMNMFSAASTSGVHTNPSVNRNLVKMFDGDISEWDVGSVTSMFSMFNRAENFNQALNDWEVGSVTSMGHMFSQATNFNQALNDWDVRSVVSMSNMFLLATSFNGDISSWKTIKVQDMEYMFNGATSFDQDISDWSLVSIKSASFYFWGIKDMFNGATSFDQDISGWDVSNIENMWKVFKGATSFNQDLSGWETDKVKRCDDFATGATAWTKSKPVKKDPKGTCNF